MTFAFEKLVDYQIAVDSADKVDSVFLFARRDLSTTSGAHFATI